MDFHELSLTKPSIYCVFTIYGTKYGAFEPRYRDIRRAQGLLTSLVPTVGDSQGPWRGSPPIGSVQRGKGWKRYRLVMRNRMEIGLKVTFIEDRLGNNIESCVSGKIDHHCNVENCWTKCQCVLYKFAKWTGYKLFELLNGGETSFSFIFIIWPWDHPAIGSGFHRLIVRKQRLFPWWLLFANLHTTKVGFPGSTCSKFWHIHSLPPCPLSQWARARTLNWARRVNWEIHANELIMFMMLIAHALVWPDGSRSQNRIHRQSSLTATTTRLRLLAPSQAFQDKQLPKTWHTWMDEWTNQRTNEWTNERTNENENERMNERTKERINQWMTDWLTECIEFNWNEM